MGWSQRLTSIGKDDKKVCVCVCTKEEREREAKPRGGAVMCVCQGKKVERMGREGGQVDMGHKKSHWEGRIDSWK